MREDGGAPPALCASWPRAGCAWRSTTSAPGWSSLSRLRRLPVHAIKVDRSFLAGVPGTPEATAILAAMLGLVDALGLEAVAEGVETEQQRDVLARQGWRAAQGYLLGAPGPAEALADRLRGAPRTAE